ncbi:MAG: aminomethyl-transferring glycine dehydrogenase subunit GcvPB [bacterium]
MRLSFELSKKGRKGYTLPELDTPKTEIPAEYLRKNSPRLPELGEVDVVRHFINLSNLNYNIDRNFYPLGSCTMKYNPKINEYTSRIQGLNEIHPLQPESTVQGALQILFELSEWLKEISGMKEVSLQPVAGAHSEFTALLVVKKYFETKGKKRTKILIPDSAHGTNPASSVIAGFTPVQIQSNAKGMIDPAELEKVMDEDTACVMFTMPNTLGMFESDISELCEIIHRKGGLVYMDGANLNAFLGILKPADIGVDIMHFNLHKTFSTPHGTGGPGGGGVGVVEKLKDFLPVPKVIKKDKGFALDYKFKNSIGRVHAFYGNFGVCVKAYTYIKMLGAKGLRRASENAIINANYVLAGLKDYYDAPYPIPCMHECVLAGKHGTKTLDIAKRLMDYGMHPPTIYFPLIVHEAIMIEPTETESIDTLNDFIETLIAIAKEADTNPDLLKSAPHNTPVGRLDEVKAARDLSVNYFNS